jgi:hypothetical protein
LALPDSFKQTEIYIMVNDSLKVTGAVTVVITDSTGAVKDTREIKNLVVATGKTFIAGRMVGVPTAMSHMASGSGVAAAAVGDTVLGTELGRVAMSSMTSTGAVVTYVAMFPAGTATGAVTEAGVFNAANAGTLLCRTVFAVVNKGVDDGMSITWAITVS